MSEGPQEVTLQDLSVADLPWMAQREKDIFGAGAWSLALLTEDFTLGGRRYRGARLSGTDDWVGYAVYGYDGDAFHLMNLAVVEEYRGRGIGRALLADFVAEARAERVSDAWLEVAVTNAPAIALYEAEGFTTVRVRRRYYQPEDVDALVMRRRITLGP